MKRISCLAILFVLFASNDIIAQNNFFADKAEKLMNNASQKRVIIPNKYKTISLDINSLQSFLATLPSEENAFVNRNNTPILELPMPDGSTAKFNVWESKVMEQGLANAFPTIKTYAGQGITDKAATIRFDMTEMGFHAMILSPFTGSVFIDPYHQKSTIDYITYYKKDFFKKDAFIELPQITINDKGNTASNTSKAFPTGQCIGNQRRNYRLAIACTYQYAQAATGLSNPTKAQVLAKIVTTVNRVTGVYEQEVGIHFNLVANNQNIIYTTAASDTALGQFNNDPYSLAPKSHSHITLIIGSANFDLGQTFSTGAGGLVINGNPTGVACDNDYKASAVTGQPNPVGDPYD
ncbi:MAG: M12 family metallo-peptidase, partial [Bacteroidetes bacterium]|nr:M12 family metallo-peptidase [Bacteroidota bacterium]